MEASVCPDCGNHIGMYYDAFVFMRETLLKNKYKNIHIDNKFLETNLNEDLSSIFNVLKIRKYCCRGKMATCKSISDLEYQN